MQICESSAALINIKNVAQFSVFQLILLMYFKWKESNKTLLNDYFKLKNN